VDSLKEVARKNEKAETLFFFGTKGGGVVDRICDLTKCGGGGLVMLDIGDSGAFYVA